jgi:hypothetical protein
MEGEAILGGTRPERFRRTRDACIEFTVYAVAAVSACSLSELLSDDISQQARDLSGASAPLLARMPLALGSRGHCCPAIQNSPFWVQDPPSAF